MKSFKLTCLMFVFVSCVAFGQVNPSFAQDDAAEQVFDFTAPPATNIRLLDVLHVGFNLEVEYIKEDNFDLDDQDAENETSLETSLSTALSFEPTDHVQLFLNVTPSYLDMDDENHQKSSDTKLELVQSFIKFKDIMGKSELILGRQRFIDDRQWIYDEEMDGLRYAQYIENFAMEVAAFKKNRQDLLGNAPNQEAVNFIAQTHYAVNRDNKIGMFVFDRRDYSSTDEDFMLIGAQYSGELNDQWLLWLNGGVVTGENGNQDIFGYGFDLGATYVMDVKLEPSLSLAYAFGSGDDDPNDDKDENFRQTGFQDNSAKLNGVTEVKTYGELFDPELSNLSVYTAGFGIKPTRKSSIDVLYHFYHQNETSTNIRNSQIDKNPNGNDKEIGQEVDVVFGVKVHKNIKFSLAAGYFKPGDAFGRSADDAQFINGEVKISF